MSISFCSIWTWQYDILSTFPAAHWSLHHVLTSVEESCERKTEFGTWNLYVNVWNYKRIIHCFCTPPQRKRWKLHEHVQVMPTLYIVIIQTSSSQILRSWLAHLHPSPPLWSSEPPLHPLISLPDLSSRSLAARTQKYQSDTNARPRTPSFSSGRPITHLGRGDEAILVLVEDFEGLFEFVLWVNPLPWERVLKEDWSRRNHSVACHKEVLLYLV